MIISICDVAPQGGCAYYRSVGPLSKLRHINKNIKIQTLSSVTWNNLFGTDILVLARPDSKHFIDMAEMAKDLNIPVWVDWDDNILEIPEYNPAYKHYRQDVIVKSVKKCLEMADVVTVSTQKIKDSFLQYNKNIHIIENAFNDYNYKFEKIDNQYDSILWRGSNTHRQDLLSVSTEIWAASRQFEKWSWVFVGENPWYITDNIKNTFCLPEVDIITYKKFIADNRSAIMQIPLFLNEFNKSKSNISWIEGVSSGAAIIAPELPEFQKPGIINYTEKEGSYKYYLEKLIKSKDFRKRNYLKSFEFIKDNLMLSNINKKRQSIVEELI